MNKVGVFLILAFYSCYGKTSYNSRSQTEGFEPDVFRNISQLISSKGYPVEEHELITSDGYILGVFRIPHGRTRDQKTVGKTVLLHHGLLSTGFDFVSNFPNQSLGFVMADSGYDVWIANARGNRYSKKHLTLSPKTSRFWQFSWDEMALIDLPETIDYVLNSTGEDKLFYVGHSMGSTVMFSLLSDKPAYNNKIRAAVALAPLALMGHTKNPSRYLIPFLKVEELFLYLFGNGELFPGGFFEQLVTEVFCQAERDVCFSWEKAFGGMSAKQYNISRQPVYLSHIPAGTSVQTLIHYAQQIKANKFQKYDFGSEGNMEKYNQSSPPEYEVERITAPVALMWGLNDPTADPTDVNLLAARLKSLTLNYQVPDPEWSHNDFVFGIDANQKVYQEVLKLLMEYHDTYESNSVK